MIKDKIRQKLIDYLIELKINLGLVKSFEIVFDYINFIKTDSYLKELMKPFLKRAKKEIKGVFELYEKEKGEINESDELSMNPIEISPEEIPNLISSETPVFGEELAKMGNSIKNNTYVNIMFFKHLYFSILFSVHDKMSKVKKLQKEGKIEEVLKIIEEIKEISIFSVPGVKIENQPETKRTSTGQAICSSMELINKYIIDEIDSQMFLDNEKPKEKISFDKEKSILYIEDFKINITRRNQKPIDHYILEAIFNEGNFQNKIPFSEISEDYLSEEYDEKWNKFRGACDNLNKKIRKDTNNKITDFIQYTTGIKGWCKINQKYL